MPLPFPLQSGEAVVLLARRHWIYFVPRFVADVLALALPPLLLGLLLRAAGGWHGTGRSLFALVALLWLLWWLLQIALLWYRYQNDLWLISDLRIVDLERRWPWRFRMSSADLRNVEDVTVTINGMLPTALDYGDIACQTAGEVQRFTFRGVPHPREIAALVEREAATAHGARPPSAHPDDAPTQRL
jgi:Zn-dependent protease with chaperone function